jgi:hypothetical protein
MMIRLKEKGTTLTWGPGPSSDPGSEIAAPAAAAVEAAAAVAATGVPRGDHPRWWWWRRDRRTGAPLRAVGLGAGLLGPTRSPLTLLGGSETSYPSARRSLCRLSSSDPPGGGGTACSPFAFVQGVGGHGGSGAGSRTDGLGTSNWCIGDLDPAVGVPASGLANRHAAFVKGRQRGQDRRPQAWVVAEHRDVLGEYQRLRDKSFPVFPPTRTASSSQDRSVPDPRWILPMSFGPVNQQHRHGLLYSSAIRCFRRSQTTCIDVRPLVAKPLILFNTGRNSSERDGLVLHCLQSSAGPSLSRMRQSLASVLAITQSLRQFSHLAPPKVGM